MFSTPLPAPSCSTACSPKPDPQPAPLPSLPPLQPSNQQQSSSMSAWEPYLEFDITPGLTANASSLDTPGYYTSLPTPGCTSAPSPPQQQPPAANTTMESKRALRDIEELLPMPKKSKSDATPETFNDQKSPATSSASPDLEDYEDDKPSTPFISKLVYLLTHSEYAKHVQWDASGKYIILAHANPQTLEMLTKFFRHTTIASFVRQLNIYGFKRLSTTQLLETLERSLPSTSFTTSDYCAFYHSDFFKPSPGHPCRVSALKPAHKERASRSKKKAVKKDSDDSASP